MKKCLCILFMFIAFHCREAYNVAPATNGNGVLVVEGILNAKGKTTIQLSRTTRLSDKRIAPEIGAFLFIEGETNGTSFPMEEVNAGKYETDDLFFDSTQRYRLRITTGDHKEYATDYKNFLITPVIDSLSWEQTGDGLNMFSYAHTNANN